MTSTLADDQGWSSGSLVSSNPELEDGSYSLLSACSWAVLIPLVHYYHRHVRNPAVPHIRRNAWVWLKLVLAASLLCLEVSSLVLRCSFSQHRHHITALTVASDIASAAGIATAVHLEHRRGVPESALLTLYIAIGLFKDVGKAQLYFFRGQSALSQLAATSASLRLALLCIQEFVEPELIIGSWSQSYSHQTLGSFCGRALSPISQTLQAWFWTVLSIDRSGNLGPEFAPASSFAALWQRSKSNQQKGGNSLLIDCLMTWKITLLAAAIARLGVTAFLFTQPWVVHCMILSHRREANEPFDLRLVGAIFLVYNGAAICKAAVGYLQSRLLTKIRAALISRIFSKSQKLRLSEAKKHTAIALISSELDGISSGFATLFDIPFFIVDTCLGMYLLVGVVRQAAFIIFLPLISASILGFVYGIYLTPALYSWNQNIESRIARTARVLAQLPAIKMLGLASKTGDFLRHLWITEIESSWNYRQIQVASISTAAFLDMITPVIVIAGALFWRIFSPKITAELVFPTLGIIAWVQDPIGRLLKSGPPAVALLGSFRRIQEYLCLEEAHDPRVLLSPQARDVTRYWPTEENTQTLSTRSVQQDPARVVHFDNVSIAPVGMDTPLLSNVTLSIAPGSVTTLFGPTGLGKSTLLNGIIGEAEVSGGVLYVNDVSIAICGQLLWLPDMTILRFIIGASAYDAAWFRTVVTVCMLDEDIDRFGEGEQHQIGSDGMKLSGGQRQRLCLARAVYTKASIILLDDVLSAVDRPTALAILFGLCGKENGLLRRLHSTVLLTGYLPECFDVADGVLLIDAYGRIEHRFGADLDDPQLACVVRLLYRDGSSDDESESESESETPRERDCRTTSPATGEGQPQGAIQRLATRPRPRPHLYRLWFDLVGHCELRDWLLLMLIMCLAESFPGIYLRWWIETSPAAKFPFFGYAFLASTAGLLGGPCVFLMMVKLSPRASIGFHDKLTDVVTHSTLGFLSANSSGSVLNRYSVDMGLIARHVPTGVYNNIYMITTTLFHVVIVLFGADYMMVLLPLFVVLIFAMQRKYIHASRHLHDRETEYQEQLVTLFRETGDGIDYIRGFGWQDFTTHHNFDLVKKSQTPFYLLLCTQQLLSLSLDLVSSNIAAALSAITLCIRGSATESSSGLTFLILMILSRSLNRSLTTWASLETSLGSVERLSDFLESTPVESDDGTTPLPENWPAHGRVEMTNVSAGYVCDIKEEQVATVIHNITLCVEPGQKVGIMGRTGGGKSSLLMSLLGLLEYEGNIVIDGVDIRQAPRDQLRSRIITITQDSVEFEGTIRDNLLPFEKDWAGVVPKTADATEAEKRRREFILRETLVHLRLWPMLEDKKELETLVSDAGFSYGERQLLCIARAAVHRRVYGGKLVLVDEATGGVDAWRDQIVREMIRDYFRGCTVLIVAHRSETVADSNISFKMVRGRVKSYKHWF